jgi:hypothetical protein
MLGVILQNLPFCHCFFDFRGEKFFFVSLFSSVKGKLEIVVLERLFNMLQRLWQMTNLAHVRIPCPITQVKAVDS